nr:PREDICTED: LOW QUALITY PROTEIN: voltage-dependent T-type calcium channel subunit alpha-1H-like [Struthio camelus australis]
MLVILLNCVTLGMFQPCEDVECQSERCTILEAFDDFIFAFFAVEMVIKMVALGIFGQKCYLGDTWNRLDFFIVMAGNRLSLKFVPALKPFHIDLEGKPEGQRRAPGSGGAHGGGMRILVTLLLDTLPMLGNVLLLCFFVFFIFGIVGVQLWAGLLRNRCFLDRNFAMTYNLTFLHPYYRTDEAEENPFICSSHRENGMQKCSNIPNRKEYKVECTLSMDSYSPSIQPCCINWNQYYNVCMAGDVNPHNGAINFDNIGYAWIAIFQVITLEGWVDIMYYVMDAHSFYNFIYFILLIIVGSFFMINLCLVVIATQFSETKQRENQLMQEQRARYLSNDSTIASFSEPGSCYEELLKYICHIFRKVKRRTIRLYNNWQSKRRKKVNPNSTTNGQSRRGKKRITSIHHLIHHHHHHHHHYHISNGSPRGPRSNPEICDLELKVMKPGGQLMLPSPSPNLQSPAPPPDSESVHSIYHADCHVEGPQVNCKSSNAPASIKLTAGLSNHGNMNYPTILPSPTSKASSVPVPKGKKNGNSPVAMVNSPVNLGTDPYGKLQQLVGEHEVRSYLGEVGGHGSSFIRDVWRAHGLCHPCYCGRFVVFSPQPGLVREYSTNVLCATGTACRLIKRANISDPPGIFDITTVPSRKPVSLVSKASGICMTFRKVKYILILVTALCSSAWANQRFILLSAAFSLNWRSSSVSQEWLKSALLLLGKRQMPGLGARRIRCLEPGLPKTHLGAPGPLQGSGRFWGEGEG